MKYLIPLLFLASCVHDQPSNAIEELSEQVIKKHEGVDIRIMPVDPEKQK
jgi:hypothetical protein